MCEDLEIIGRGQLWRKVLRPKVGGSIMKVRENHVEGLEKGQMPC